MSLNQYNLQECVSKKTKLLHSEEPKRTQAQNVSIAYKHCRDNMQQKSLSGMDSIQFKNQVLASEGVLDYGSDRKLKRWDDLKKFIGKVVPIVDEHPDINNGNDGKVSDNEEIWGIATVKQCSKGIPVICFDSIMKDNAPVKKGYSMGFIFHSINKSGSHFGSDYNLIQGLDTLDHIALTDLPRNDIALKSDIGIDSLHELHSNTEKDSNNVVKYYFGYDSIKSFTIDSNNVKKEESNDKKNDTGDNMAANKEKEKKGKEKKKVEEDEEEDEEKDEDEEEKEDKFNFSKKKSSGSDSKLKSRIEKLERLFAASEIDRDSLKIKNNELTVDSKRNHEKYIKQLNKNTKIEIDSLVKSCGLKESDFDGKNIDFINGASFIAEHISKQPSSSISGMSDVDSSDDEEEEFENPNNMHYDADSGKMVKN